MVMDFIGDQERARARTWKLVVLFGIAVVAICIAVYAATAMLIGVLGANVEDASTVAWSDPIVIFGSVGITLLVIVGGSLLKTVELSRGGSVVAEALGGKPIPPGTKDPLLRRTQNVVEEMAIASGCPVPPVYLIDDQSINAFAAGFTFDSAVIGVTRGCVERLSRDELQGVMAHEFSHIVHGDMRLNIRLTGFIFGIMVIGLIGQIVFRGALYGSMGSRRDKGNAALLFIVFGLLLTFIGAIGTFAAQLIQAAVSRQREFLADASAVNYTRNPAGIAGALRRIGGMSKNTMSRPAASQFEHFFFTKALSSAFATHPPLPIRIARIEHREVEEVEAEHAANRRSIGEQRVAMIDAKQPTLDPPPDRRIDPASLGVAAIASSGSAGVGSDDTNWQVRSASEIRSSVQHMGDADDTRIAYARSLLGSIPSDVRDAVGDEFGARAVCLLLLVDEDADIRGRQAKLIDEQADPATATEVMRLRRSVENIVTSGPELRLVLMDLAMPALFRCGRDSADRFLALVDAMAAVDGRVDRFEWLLSRLLRSHLEHLKSGGSKKVSANRSLQILSNEARIVLAMVAWSGSRNDAQAESVFQSSARAAGLGNLDFPQRHDCSVAALDRALDRLQRLRYGDRGRLLDAAVEGVCADGRATIGEVELLRALAGALSCPMPPVLPGPVPTD